MYTEFAQVYDELMNDVNYKAWAAYYNQLMNHYGIRSGRIAECACGTGGLTIPLYQLGYQITGIDLSAEMLWEASQKARKGGMSIPFIKQDMCHLRLHKAMDAILCTCDGVNYLLSSERVKAFFQAAYAALRPGGALFFDISTPYKLKEILGDNSMIEDGEHITFSWQNSYHNTSDTVSMHLIIFIKQEDGSYRRIDEIQKQKAHGFLELKQLLEETGFAQIMCFGDKHMYAPSETERRWHIAARKPADPMAFNI